MVLHESIRYIRTISILTIFLLYCFYKYKNLVIFKTATMITTDSECSWPKYKPRFLRSYQRYNRDVSLDTRAGSPKRLRRQPTPYPRTESQTVETKSVKTNEIPTFEQTQSAAENIIIDSLPKQSRFRNLNPSLSILRGISSNNPELDKAMDGLGKFIRTASGAISGVQTIMSLLDKFETEVLEDFKKVIVSKQQQND